MLRTEKKRPAAAEGAARARQVVRRASDFVTIGSRCAPCARIQQVEPVLNGIAANAAKRANVAHGWSPIVTEADHDSGLPELQRVSVESTEGIVDSVPAVTSGWHGSGSLRTRWFSPAQPMPPSPTYETFAECLRMLRAKRQITQADVAKGTGIATSTISDFENAKNAGPGVGELAALAQFFDVPSDYFLGRAPATRAIRPGLWIVDLEEERDPTGPRSDWASEIPARYEVLTEAEKIAREPAVKARWKAKEKRDAHE